MTSFVLDIKIVDFGHELLLVLSSSNHIKEHFDHLRLV